MLALLLMLILFGWLGFELSRGPVAIPHLASWFATHMTGEGIDVRVNKAELAWSGYHQGGIVPFVLQLAGIEVRTQSGDILASVPGATLSLPAVDLFGGRKPVTLTGEGATFSYSSVPVSWYAQLWPGAGFALEHSDVHVKIGAGKIGQGQDSIALARASFVLSVLHDGSVRVANGQASLMPQGQSTPNLTFSFLGRYKQGWQGLLHVGVDKVQAQDLPALWPPALLPVTRHWITNHIPSGDAENADFTFGLEAEKDLSHFQISALQGQFKIHDVTLVWMTGAPPLTAVNGLFTVSDLNTGIITATSGAIGGVEVHNSTLKISGLADQAQSGLLKMELAGPVQNVLTVLAAPPFHLLGHVPDDIMKKVSGTVQASLQANIPFKRDLTQSEVSIKIQATLSHLRVPTLLPGIFLTNGQMFLKSDGQELNATATAALAGYPVSLTVAQNLSRSDDDVRFRATGLVDSSVWQALGLQMSYVAFQGAVPFILTLNGPWSGSQQAGLKLDLTPVSFAVPALGWEKQKGDAAKGEVSFTLRNQKLNAVQKFDIQAPGLFIEGHGEADDLTIEQARIGKSQMSASLTRSTAAGAPWVLQCEGNVLDLRLRSLLGQGQVQGQGQGQVQGQGEEQKTTVKTMPTFPWRLSLAFTKIYTAAPPAKPLVNVKLTASGQGSAVTAANITAQDVSATVAPLSGGEHSLSLRSNNAGTFLEVLGIYKGMSGGTLNLQAMFGNGMANGTVRLDDLRLLHAPGFTKILEAATLYGVAEALSGPGLLLDHIKAPFTLNQNILTLHGADAYSEALGFTASGTVDMGTSICDLDATIIPAYALNSFLGKIPLIGHLFTAERGGGLFAMRAHIQGRINDPQVTVNPISVLVPGFLRGIFGLGERTEKSDQR